MKLSIHKQLMVWILKALLTLCLFSIKELHWKLNLNVDQIKTHFLNNSLDFFKLLVNNKEEELTEQHLKLVIGELCGPISHDSREIILDKTFQLFGARRNQNISEETFVNVLK